MEGESGGKAVRREDLSADPKNIATLADELDDASTLSETLHSSSDNGDDNEPVEPTLKNDKLYPELESTSSTMRRCNTRLLNNKRSYKPSLSSDKYRSSKLVLKSLVEDEISSESINEKILKKRKLSTKIRTRNKKGNGEEGEESKEGQDIEATESFDDKDDEAIQKQTNTFIKFVRKITNTWGSHRNKRGYFSQVCFIPPNTKHIFLARTVGIIYLPYKNSSEIHVHVPLTYETSDNKVIQDYEGSTSS